MAYLYRLIVILIIALPNSVNAQSAPVGAIDLAGWVKGADGTYSKAFGESTVTRTIPPNNSVSSTSTAMVQTSKGLQSFDLQKTASVDVARVGASVVSLAKKLGPVGMGIGAVSLVCELSNICNQAGDWMLKQVNFGGTAAGNYPSCQEAIGLAAGANWQDCTTINNAHPGAFWFRSPSTPAASANCTNRGGTSWTYTAVAYTCTNPPANYVPVTDADFTTATPKLNDSRFAPELNDKGADIPTGIPTLTPNQKKQLGLDSVPTKDSSGNITGREDTSTEIEAVDAGTSDNPGRVIIKETKTTIKYDTNNTQISSTTNTSYSSQPQEKEPPQYTISFDSVPEATLQTYSVPNTFSSDSWGSGTCPPNIDVSLTNHSFTIPTQPVCDTAVMINPFTLLLASIISVYIIAGVRGGSAT